MTSNLVRFPPSLQQALSLDHLRPRSDPMGAAISHPRYVQWPPPNPHAKPGSGDSDRDTPSSEADYFLSARRPDRTVSASGVADISRSVPAIVERDDHAHPSSRSSVLPRTRLSLSALITSNKLLRRLSSAPASPGPAPTPASYSPPILPQYTRPSTGILTSSPPLQPRRSPSARFTTSPSATCIGSGWELLEGREELVEDTGSTRNDVICGQQGSPYSQSGIQSHGVTQPPRRIPLHIAPRSPAETKVTHPNKPVSAPNSPCQKVWLCSPPKSLPSPILSPPICQRRPPIITRAHSTARLSRESDENGALLHLSSHSERMLPKQASAKEKHLTYTRNRTGEGRPALARALSDAQAAGSATSVDRPAHGRSFTTGGADRLPSVAFATSVSGRSSSWTKESGSREPLL